MTLPTTYRTASIEGLGIFYREAGDPKNPTLVLLHGYPSSSFMFRNLITDLSDRFHLIAPDFPGFGGSDAPAVGDFAYTFDRLADVTEKFLLSLGLTQFSLYVQDYGAPVGFRIAARHPEWIEALIVQNGNAYEEGFTPAWEGFRALWQDRNAATEAAVAAFFTPETTRFFYNEGTRDPAHLSPDTWNLDQYFLDKPANRAAQMELFYDYRNNPPLYPVWHEYFRTHQPRTLIAWGKNDPFFGPEGAAGFQRDLPNAEVTMLDTGHFALEEDGAEIASLIRGFLDNGRTDTEQGPVFGIGRLVARPGMEAQVRRATEAVVAESLREEGCLSFALYQGAEDSAVLLLHHSWDSLAARQAHFDSPHIAAFFASVGESLAEPFAFTPLSLVSV